MTTAQWIEEEVLPVLQSGHIYSKVINIAVCNKYDLPGQLSQAAIKMASFARESLPKFGFESSSVDVQDDPEITLVICPYRIHD